MRKRSDYYWFAIILFSSLLTLAAVLGDWGNPLRWVLLLWFLLFCPGMAFAHLFPSEDQISRFFLVIVLSFALDTAVAQVILYMGKWSPRLILLILIGICLFGTLSKFLTQISRDMSTSILTINPKGAYVKDIRHYFRIIQHGWWLILISALTTVNFSLIYSYYVATPLYEVVAQFVVSPSLQNIDDKNTINSPKAPDKFFIISTYAAIINSQQIADNTMKLLNKNQDDFIKYKTSVTSFPDENIIQLTVKGPNPEIAVMLANSIGQYSIIYINNVYDNYHIAFLNKAIVPIAPSQPPFVQDAVFALLIGLVIGIGLTIFRDLASVTS